MNFSNVGIVILALNEESDVEKRVKINRCRRKLYNIYNARYPFVKGEAERI